MNILDRLDVMALTPRAKKRPPDAGGLLHLGSNQKQLIELLQASKKSCQC